MGTPIFVLDQQGKPLMPTRRHNKVWYWLRKGLARVVRREPFTIQLRFDTSSYQQTVTVGVDTGSQVVGIAATANGQVLFQAEMQLRQDISENMVGRREKRRRRRAHNTRYRKARFDNRKRSEGWLPPSIYSKEQATCKVISWVASFLAVSQVHLELASFDTQKLANPEISGVLYQQGELFGYCIREYLLGKWQRHCAYCGKNGIPLQVEHIIPRLRGGSDRITNLTLACEACNQLKGNRTATEFGFPNIQEQARHPLKDAAHVSALKTALLIDVQARFGAERVQTRYGYQTKYQRIQVLGWAKSHAHDAAAIACEMGKMVTPSVLVHYLRCLPRGRYQLFNGKHSKHKVWAPRKVRGWKLYEQVEAKGKIGYVGGRREKGSFVMRDLFTGKPLLEVAPSRMKRIMRPQAGWLVFSEICIAKEGGASSPN
jgi:5-methylcytosine-specific restriction endonuclease McrA